MQPQEYNLRGGEILELHASLGLQHSTPSHSHSPGFLCNRRWFVVSAWVDIAHGGGPSFVIIYIVTLNQCNIFNTFVKII